MQAYGRTQTQGDMAHIPLSPVVLMKQNLDEREADWKKASLPAGYVDNKPAAITAVQKIIRDLLKYEKRSLTKLVSTRSNKFLCM